VILLALTNVSAARSAGLPPAERPGYQIGCTAHRTNLLGGQRVDSATARATDGRNKKALSKVPGFICGLNASPDGKQVCYHKDYRAIR
jgi:hypothetical protein